MPKRDYVIIAVLSIITGLTLPFLARVPGAAGREWWIIPSLIFAAFLVPVVYTRRRPPVSVIAFLVAALAGVGLVLRFV